MITEQTENVYVEIEEEGFTFGADVRVDMETEGKHPFGTMRITDAEIVGEVIVRDENGVVVNMEYPYEGEMDEELIEKAKEKARGC